MKVKNSFRLLVLLMSGFIAACGSSNTSEPTTAITGSIFQGPVNGASVTVKKADGSAVAGPVTTGSDGSYSISIPDSALSGDLVFESAGGTFTDEATGTTDVAAVALSAHISGGALSSGGAVHVTPCTTIVQKLVALGKTKTEAETAFGTAFGFIPDSTLAPTDATNPATGASDEQKLAGSRVAVFSQLAKDMDESQSHLLEHLPEDLEDDGILNGLPPYELHLPEDIGNKYELAVVNFLNNTNNKSGLTPDKIGTLPFSKTALTTTYKVTYVEGSMKAMQGKTTFKISVTKRSDGAAAPGLTVTLAPLMHMAAYSHVTPIDSITDDGDGAYTCVVYYLMAGGPTMGYWELTVGVNGETATFYPAVGMSMGDTTKVTLKHKDDTIPNMMGTLSPRAYPLFKEALTAETGGAYTFKAFVTSQESMTSFPKLFSGIVLSSGTTSELTVNPLSVQASTDGTTWTAMTEDTVNEGHFSVSGLTGLSSGVAGTVYVKLTINGNDYVDNATGDSTAAGAHIYATFNVTPGGM
ncbi:MAG: hypothetical protein HY786_07915 [Deltaproteobacteria bacterium]|nr:hypothetical protein [Deltaproteobacteria bacterium]